MTQTAIDIPKHFQLQFDPIADPRAVIQAGKARFTLLTSRLVRIEYSPQGTFEDRPSQVFWYRRQPVPEFTAREEDGVLVIETPHLTLFYHLDRPFSPETLSARIHPTGDGWQGQSWRFGDPATGNLGGTLRTLDRLDGPVPLPPGLMSRQGWTVLDDSRSLVFDPQGWLAPRPADPEYRDLYLFAYGHAYPECLRDYTRLAGAVPLVPRWALGNWWSRYWAYTQDDLVNLVLAFEAHEVPLLVLIVDMDWHITETGNACTGWTGYTWNRELFPNPDGFIAFLHSKGLKTALNLHPAEGVHAHEEAYFELAKCMGIDPESALPVPFDLANPRFTEAYFRILHHPEEKRGVDFWWLDWQQGTLSTMPGLDPLWWLNHLHALDRGRDGSRRPFTFSRWSGYGNHRYPIGFSGDTHVTWEALAFQPYFTSTAANVGYGWWSHDIGGHMLGVEDAELYTRWVQFGVFSPIFRLHSTKNPYHERLPWGYDLETFRVAREAMQLRHALGPYIYSMAWREHRGEPPLLRPMYYTHPEQEEAYACPDQYWFGSELVVAPFTSPHHPDTRLARQVVWLPEGEWYGFFDGERYPGGGWQAVYGALDEIPVFARAGAIVPLAPESGWNPRADRLDLHVFPGADNHFELYEDDGDTTAYTRGAYAITPIDLHWEDDRLVLRIRPVAGEAGLAPDPRRVEMVFHGLLQPDSATLSVNGVDRDAGLLAEPESQRTTAKRHNCQPTSWRLAGLALSPQDEATVTLCRSGGLQAPGARLERTVLHFLRHFRMSTRLKAILDESLPEILADPVRLSPYLSSLTPAQTRAFCEALFEAGIHRASTTGPERILLWNKHGDERVRWNLSLEQLEEHDMQQRFIWESGPLPRFKSYDLDSNLSKGPWRLNVGYANLFNVIEEGKPTRRPGPSLPV